MSVVSSARNLSFQQSSSSAVATRRLSVVADTKKPKKKHKKKKPLTPKQIAWKIMGWFHWKAKWQFKYLNWLWTRESSWNKYATNPYSGAYGIPQAMPGSKMASCGKDWRTNAKTQIRWGMRYIKREYGTPKAAWVHEVNDGWY
ncbi:MAG TPA: transglycosylase SLT domain-containing protein [Streptosporangiaceae bacterium]|nr:transglycosylase SLT domain-containing protein [Streptosporangiaceae bacterium]